MLTPSQLNKAIAHYLETDKDISNYSQLCRATSHAVDGDNLSFWRTKFREKYACKAGVPNKDLKQKYTLRSKWLYRGTGVKFVRGHGKDERQVVEILAEMINETFQGPAQLDEEGHPRCPNQVQLLKFIMDSRILLDKSRPPPPKKGQPTYVDQRLAAVKLMCAHFLFDLEGLNQYVFAVEESQQAVYAPTNEAPIYTGPSKTDVNLEWVLHCLNFFRHHMTNKHASQLCDKMRDLPASQKPSVWRGPLKNGSHPLGKYWKGTYAYLENPDLQKFRRMSEDKKKALRTEDIYFADMNVEEGQIQVCLALHVRFH